MLYVYSIRFLKFYCFLKFNICFMHFIQGSESSAQTGKSWEKIPTEGEDNEEEEDKLKVQITKEEEVGDSKVRKSLRKRKNKKKKNKE